MDDSDDDIAIVYETPRKQEDWATCARSTFSTTDKVGQSPSNNFWNLNCKPKEQPNSIGNSSIKLNLLNKNGKRKGFANPEKDGDPKKILKDDYSYLRDITEPKSSKDAVDTDKNTIICQKPLVRSKEKHGGSETNRKEMSISQKTMPGLYCSAKYNEVLKYLYQDAKCFLVRLNSIKDLFNAYKFSFWHPETISQSVLNSGCAQHANIVLIFTVRNISYFYGVARLRIKNRRKSERREIIPIHVDWISRCDLSYANAKNITGCDLSAWINQRGDIASQVIEIDDVKQWQCFVDEYPRDKSINLSVVLDVVKEMCIYKAAHDRGESVKKPKFAIANIKLPLPEWAQGRFTDEVTEKKLEDNFVNKQEITDDDVFYVDSRVDNEKKCKTIPSLMDWSAQTQKSTGRNESPRSSVAADVRNNTSTCSQLKSNEKLRQFPSLLNLPSKEPDAQRKAKPGDATLNVSQRDWSKILSFAEYEANKPQLNCEKDSTEKDNSIKRNKVSLVYDPFETGNTPQGLFERAIKVVKDDEKKKLERVKKAREKPISDMLTSLISCGKPEEKKKKSTSDREIPKKVVEEKWDLTRIREKIILKREEVAAKKESNTKKIEPNPKNPYSKYASKIPDYEEREFISEIKSSRESPNSYEDDVISIPDSPPSFKKIQKLDSNKSARTSEHSPFTASSETLNYEDYIALNMPAAISVVSTSNSAPDYYRNSLTELFISAPPPPPPLILNEVVESYDSPFMEPEIPDPQAAVAAGTSQAPKYYGNSLIQPQMAAPLSVVSAPNQAPEYYGSSLIESRLSGQHSIIQGGNQTLLISSANQVIPHPVNSHANQMVPHPVNSCESQSTEYYGNTLINSRMQGIYNTNQGIQLPVTNRVPEYYGSSLIESRLTEPLPVTSDTIRMAPVPDTGQGFQACGVMRAPAGAIRAPENYGNSSIGPRMSILHPGTNHPILHSPNSGPNLAPEFYGNSLMRPRMSSPISSQGLLPNPSRINPGSQYYVSSAHASPSRMATNTFSQQRGVLVAVSSAPNSAAYYNAPSPRISSFPHAPLRPVRPTTMRFPDPNYVHSMNSQAPSNHGALIIRNRQFVPSMDHYKTQNANMRFSDRDLEIKFEPLRLPTSHVLPILKEDSPSSEPNELYLGSTNANLKTIPIIQDEESCADNRVSQSREDIRFTRMELRNLIESEPKSDEKQTILSNPARSEASNNKIEDIRFTRMELRDLIELEGKPNRNINCNIDVKCETLEPSVSEE